MSIDKQGTRILARNFFNQLRASGYSPMQIIGMATEVLVLVSEDLKGVDKGVIQPTQDARPGFRQEA